MLESLRELAFFLTRLDEHHVAFMGLGLPEQPIDRSSASIISRQIEGWLKLFQSHDLSDSVTATEKVLAKVSLMSYAELGQRMTEIKENFIRDCWRERRVYVIDSAMGKYVDAGFGPGVEASFPDALSEIREASTCYALGRNTACVFHLMRGVEHGLRSLVVALGAPTGKIPFAYQEWNPLIEQADKAWRDAVDGWGKLGKSVEQTNARAFFKRLIADLHAFKDDVRNITMHARDSYDGPGALSVRGRVEAWFQVLSTRVEEDMVSGSALDPALFGP